MTSFPRSPRLMKGAIVSLNLPNPIPNVIIFQYNPATLQRSVQARTQGGGASGGSAEGQGGQQVGDMKLRGAAIETITLNVEIDATDQLERGDGLAADVGIYPQLSSLEMLIYPSSIRVLANLALSLAGVIEAIPPSAPFTLFIWGPKRILPVKIATMTISEQAYDTSLNPIRAQVSLSMRVLTYSDLPVDHVGHHLFLAHQIVKETMAVIGSVNNLGAVIGGDVKLL